MKQVSKHISNAAIGTPRRRHQIAILSAQLCRSLMYQKAPYGLGLEEYVAFRSGYETDYRNFLARCTHTINDETACTYVDDPYIQTIKTLIKTMIKQTDPLAGLSLYLHLAKRGRTKAARRIIQIHHKLCLVTQDPDFEFDSITDVKS